MPITINKKITINGKEVSSLDELGEEFAEAFGDKNNDGVPDKFEGLIAMAKKEAEKSSKYPKTSSVNKSVNTSATFSLNHEPYKEKEAFIPEAPIVNAVDPNEADKAEKRALLLNNTLKWGFLISALYVILKLALNYTFK